MIRFRYFVLAAILGLAFLSVEAAVPGMRPAAQCQPPECDEDVVCTSPLHCSINCWGDCSGTRGDPGNCQTWP